jgi:hypothetical protein
VRPPNLIDKQVPRYDRPMNFFDRVLFGGGRECACSHARRRVADRGRKRAQRALLSDGISLTAIEFSPEMLALARARAERIGRKVESSKCTREPACSRRG